VRPQLEVPFTAPRNATEKVVVAIWSEVLQFPEIGVHDSLFDLGGHSLTAFLILSRIQDTFGVEVPLPVLLDTPTVAGLAAFLDRGAA
jgi:surfactin family lipopeptide synthetase A